MASLASAGGSPILQQKDDFQGGEPCLLAPWRISEQDMVAESSAKLERQRQVALREDGPDTLGCGDAVV